eukprot:scaffold39058_cov266-Skeletonema_dohrnii-CCMP3373.AAC.1
MAMALSGERSAAKAHVPPYMSTPSIGASWWRASRVSSIISRTVRHLLPKVFGNTIYSRKGRVGDVR